MYVRPAKTQISLCIDPLDKASFLHTVRSAKGLDRMCCCSRTFIPLWTARLSMVNMISECSYQNVRRVLTRVFARRTRLVTPSDHRGYLQLAKALIRLLRSADVQSQSVHADPSLRTSFIVGFAMHRLMRELFVQTLTLSTLGTVYSRQHFEIFFSFFQENIICTSCKLSPLHEMSNPVFLVMKRKKTKTNSICRLLN